MSYPGHLQDPPAPIKPAGKTATKTTTKTISTTNAQTHHRSKPEYLARIPNLVAYLARDEIAEMRALGMITADDEWRRVGVMGGDLEAWEESWEQMGVEAALVSTPADAGGEEEKEVEKEAEQPAGKVEEREEM